MRVQRGGGPARADGAALLADRTIDPVPAPRSPAASEQCYAFGRASDGAVPKDDPEALAVRADRLVRMDSGATLELDRVAIAGAPQPVGWRLAIAKLALELGAWTTRSKASWMGVPVVTLAGEPHAARVGASLLSAPDSARAAQSAPKTT